MFSECLVLKNGNVNKLGEGKSNARVFALQYDEAPTVDTFTGTLSIAS